MPLKLSECASCTPLAHDAFTISVMNVRVTRMRRSIEFIRDHAREPSTKLWAQSLLDSDDLLS